MRELLPQLKQLLADRRPTAYCRLVETRGSTPQKAGATMLVYADGSQAGTLGGGCVEAEVKRRALGVLDRGVAEVCRFQLDHDYGWDDGLICGGRMEVLIQPVAENMARDYFLELVRAIEASAGVSEVIVFDEEASGLPAPSSYLFDGEGHLLATESVAEAVAIEASLHQIVARLPALETRPRAQASGGIAMLPLLSRCRLVIVGGGHVGKAVTELASELDFDVWVVDDRQEYASPERFPRAQNCICGDIEEVLPGLEINSDTYCLIVTRGHQHDERALYHLADRGARYVGMIGSRRKIKMIYQDLLEEGLAAEALEQVYAPLGIEIGSQTVAEIAVSICAELVAHRNLGGQVPGRSQQRILDAAESR
jgi:xanthine dehydrogenase accessory factor